MKPSHSMYWFNTTNRATKEVKSLQFGCRSTRRLTDSFLTLSRRCIVISRKGLESKWVSNTSNTISIFKVLNHISRVDECFSFQKNLMQRIEFGVEPTALVHFDFGNNCQFIAVTSHLFSFTKIVSDDLLTLFLAMKYAITYGCEPQDCHFSRPSLSIMGFITHYGEWNNEDYETNKRVNFYFAPHAAVQNRHMTGCLRSKLHNLKSA